MPAEIILQPSPNAAALAEKRERLSAVRAELADREADIAQLRSQMKVFEVRYLQRVGVPYAEASGRGPRVQSPPLSGCPRALAFGDRVGSRHSGAK